MIPKLIHCVWLSGENKPDLHIECRKSWEKYMPDFEIKEWNITNLPKEVITHPFVNAAIKARKWAFATDYIRVWALYTFGGIYFDYDVEVYRSFSPFLKHAAFSCIEFNPRNFYKYMKKKHANFIRGLNIEAAVIGSSKGHNWVKDIMSYYNNIEFNTDTATINQLIMPLIVTKVSLSYGFRYIPIYQVLEQDVHIYPPDTFSSCYDLSITRCTEQEIGRNCIRYARHKCAHSWYENNYNSTQYKIKRFILNIIGKKTVARFKKILNNRNIIYNNI